MRGRDDFLRAEPGSLGEAQRWIAEYTGFWESSADALARHVEGRAAGATEEAGATGDNDSEEAVR